MPLGIGIALIALGLLAYKSGALASFGVPAPIASAPTYNPAGLQANVSLTAPPIANPGGGTVAGANLTPVLISGGVSIGTAAVATPVTFAALGLTGAAAGVALAGIGVVAIIAAALWAAHEKRKAQAQDENTATNVGITGYDSDLRLINQYYVSRQIDAVSAIQLVQSVMQHYWALVGPHIQPGRNGCQGGGVCPTPTGTNPCSGDIGAACCVGCYDLAGQSEPHLFPGFSLPMYFGIAGTIAVLQQGGGTVYYQQVYPSSYGTKGRAAYTLNWVQAAVA